MNTRTEITLLTFIGIFVILWQVILILGNFLWSKK